MSRIAFFAVALIAGIVLTEAAIHDPVLLQSFNGWRAKFNKNYENDVAFDHAYHNYVATLSRTEAKNAAHSRAHFGPTLFADLSPAEFRAKYLNLDGKKVREAYKSAALNVAEPQSLPEQFNGELPADYDWATIKNSPVTYVKDQGQCGSCWTFSVAENIESQVYLAGKSPNGKLTTLSEQQIVDCDKGTPIWPDQGCDGGFTQGAFEYVIRAGGLQSEDSYPYTSGDSGSGGNCQFDKTKIVSKIDGWQYAVPMCNDSCDHQNSTLLMQQLVSIGPLSICVVATDDWQDYEWGILEGFCPHDANDINHGVQLTGYANGKNEGWWIIRNSWSDQWGMSGYIWVGMPNECGVADIATYAVINQ